MWNLTNYDNDRVYASFWTVLLLLPKLLAIDHRQTAQGATRRLTRTYPSHRQQLDPATNEY